jgi:hypothetical protein
MRTALRTAIHHTNMRMQAMMVENTATYMRHIHMMATIITHMITNIHMNILMTTATCILALVPPIAMHQA